MTIKNGRNYTEEFIQYMRENFPHRSTKEISKECGIEESLLSNLADRKGIKKSEQYLTAWREKSNANLSKNTSTRFKKGHVPWTAGKKGIRMSKGTEFKKGSMPHNTLPVGSIKLDKDGYQYVKIADAPGKKSNRWKALHHVIWEQHHGPLPKNHIVIFRDKNQNNMLIENLECISRHENMSRNTMGRFPAELISAIRTLNKIKKQIQDGQKQN
jgi:hypothetical protein